MNQRQASAEAVQQDISNEEFCIAAQEVPSDNNRKIIGFISTAVGVGLLMRLRSKRQQSERQDISVEAKALEMESALAATTDELAMARLDLALRSLSPSLIKSLRMVITSSDAVKAESATEAFPKWQKRLGAGNVGLIHGKLRPEEKDAVMEDFRSGKTKALVATTVIEVGVDVPNANLMILHHAERFGLAQIHQLRGRIGRGEHKSYCILLTDSKIPEAIEKLNVLEKTSDGFEIAEADLRLRGPGDILGTAQSGLTDLRFADFITDTELIRQARSLADQVFKEDPDLTRDHANLRPFISESAAPQAVH
jgi:superfamily II DNA/RNA helicase